jgi:WhiB family redox-sensing transcriptional regulator
MGTNVLRRVPSTAPACTFDPDLFHSDEPDDVSLAKAICAGCPIRRNCLAQAVARAEPHGVWGGQDPTERGMKPSRYEPTGPRSSAVEDRRRRVVELSRRMEPCEIAAVLGIPLHLVYADRIREGIASPKIDRPAKAVELHEAGMTVGMIAAQIGVRTDTVKRYLVQQPATAAP